MGLVSGIKSYGPRGYFRTINPKDQQPVSIVEERTSWGLFTKEYCAYLGH